MNETPCEEEILIEMLVTDENKEEIENLYGVMPEEVQEKYNYENEVAE